MKRLKKLIKRLFLLTVVVIVIAGCVLAGSGYKMYRDALNHQGLESKVAEIQSNPSYTTSVSYTHLDVYKRQALISANSPASSRWTGFPAERCRMPFKIGSIAFSTRWIFRINKYSINRMLMQIAAKNPYAIGPTYLALIEM